MKKTIKITFLLSTLIFFFALPCRGAGEFIFGICQGDERALPYLIDLGIKWARVNISWKEVMPELKAPLLTLKHLQAHPEELVEELSQKTDWSKIDHKLKILLENHIQPVPIVGHGYRWNYSRYQGKSAHPDRIGRDQYLAYMYLYTRAVVERYDGDGYLDAPGIRIKIWQIENELNQAGLTAGWGWREPEWIAGLFSAWANWDFLTRLLQTLHQAVKDADPQAKTFMNFHTDIPPKLSRFLRDPDWLEAIDRWKDYMEIIAFDAYPNYYSPEPVRGEEIAKRIEQIREIVGNKPIIIAEIDYPSGPVERGFTPEKQAEFLKASYQSARKAGASGYFKLAITGPDSHPVKITEKDLKVLKKIIPWWEQEKVGRLFFWALFHSGYIKNHFLEVIKSVEGYWGVVSPEGEKKPGYFVLKELAQKSK